MLWFEVMKLFASFIRSSLVLDAQTQANASCSLLPHWDNRRVATRRVIMRQKTERQERRSEARNSGRRIIVTTVIPPPRRPRLPQQRRLKPQSSPLGHDLIDR
jgi:hypothetical protein